MDSTHTTTAEISVGSVFASHSIEAVLGRGGMGVVYRATDLRLDRPAALKVIKPEVSADPDFRKRFERESQLAASVRHPNVVTIFQAGEHDGLLFVTMELVEGTDLRALIHERGRLEPGLAGAITMQMAEALDAAHARGLVHRDVKPANALIASGHRLQVYLTDFGLTKRASSQSGVTKTGVFVGTIDYASPEQIKGWPVDARTDVYALGCVLFEMLVGTPPFRRDNEYSTMYAQTSEPPPSLMHMVPGVSPQLDAVVQRALSKDPDERFMSAGDLGRAALAATTGDTLTAPERTVAIGRAAPGAPIETAGPPVQETTPPPPPAPPSYPPPGSHPTTALPPRRTPWLAITIVLVALLLVGGGVTAAVVLSGNDGKSSTTAKPPVSSGDTGTTDKPQPPDAVKKGTEDMASVVELARQGRRDFTANQSWDAAAENRRAVLARLDQLSVPAKLDQSKTLMRQAMNASLQADIAHAACNCNDRLPQDNESTDLKEQFVSEFNPFADKYLGQTFDADEI